MFRRSGSRTTLALVCGIAITSPTLSALGQTATNTSSGTTGSTSSGASLSKGVNGVKRDPERASTKNAADPIAKLTMTRGDCKTDVKYTFTMNVKGYTSGMTLIAYAGPSSSNCIDQFKGSYSTKDCWRLSESIPVENGLTATATYTVKKLFGIGYTGTETIDPVLSSCDAPSTSNTRTSFNIHFLMTKGSDVVADWKEPLYYDLGGPEAVTNVKASPAEKAIKLNWTPLSKQEGEIVYRFWCARVKEGQTECQSALNARAASTASAGGSSSAGGASSIGGDSSGRTSSSESATASSAGGTTSAFTVATPETSASSQGGATATTELFTEALSAEGGSDSTDASSLFAKAEGGSSESTSSEDGYEEPFECGFVRGMATGTAYAKSSNLENDQTYAVSVVAEDFLGNTGTYSEPVCTIPIQADTFFERYRMEGGRGGGGFTCGISYGRRSLATAGLFIAALGLSVRLRRNRAKRNA